MCLCGDVSDQGCAAYGCPQGTRRICNCTSPTGGFCTPISIGPFTWNCVWSCYCQPDPTCAPPPPTCNQGEAFGCGEQGCGPEFKFTCVDGYNWQCVWDASCACTPTAPQTPTLNSPANGSTVSPDSVTLRWNAISNWGTTCTSRNNRYIVQYKEQPTGSCSGGGYTSTYRSSSQTSMTLSGLNTNSRYCWYVQATNGERTSGASTTWTFTTTNSPNLDGSNFSSSMNCGNGISGNAGITGTDNPITFWTEYSFTGGGGTDEIDEVLISIIPDDVRNANIVSETAMASASEDYFMARVIINHTNLLDSQFQIVNSNSNPYYSTSQTSGDLTNTNNTASLLNLNSASSDGTRVEVIDSDTLRIYWTIRFEDNYKYKLNGDLYTSVINANIYSAGLREYAPGQWVSSAGGISRSLEKLRTWGINVQIPQITISDPIIVSENTFDINWNVDGFDLTQANGYMWTNGETITLHRTSPNPISDFTLTSTEPADFSPTNIDVTETNLGTHRYNITTPPNDTLTFSSKMSVSDTACNAITDSGTGISVGNSWFMTAFSDVYANNITNNAQNVNIDPPVTGLGNYTYTSSFLTSINQSNLSSSTRASKYHYILESYEDYNKTATRATNENWFEYLYNLVLNNIGTDNMPSISGNKTMSNLTSTFLSSEIGITVNKYASQHVLINGNLNVESNTTCDTKTIFFVNGDLSINPDFNIENNPTNNAQMGCLFIVKQDIRILDGEDKNLNNNSLQRFYDNIDAFFITNGTFYSNFANDPHDGLLIKGSIVANQIDLSRKLGLLYDSVQPAEIIEYDNRYGHIFAQELFINKYSIREKDFLQKVYR